MAKAEPKEYWSQTKEGTGLKGKGRDKNIDQWHHFELQTGQKCESEWNMNRAVCVDVKEITPCMSYFRLLGVSPFKITWHDLRECFTKVVKSFMVLFHLGAWQTQDIPHLLCFTKVNKEGNVLVSIP